MIITDHTVISGPADPLRDRIYIGGIKMFEKVKALLVEELSIDADEITPSAELVNDLGINSLELADLVMLCEDKFGVEIDDEEAQKFVTVGDVAEYLSSRIK